MAALKFFPAQAKDPQLGPDHPLMNLSIDIENRLVVARGEGAGEGWTGSLGLVDASYYI